MTGNRPLFIVSDLHMGAGGPRDSFAQRRRSRHFHNFLDFVQHENGDLIILGDFMDLWRFALRNVLRARWDLLDRLAEMRVSCVPGNHDGALAAFIGSTSLPHAFFGKIVRAFVRTVGGRRFSFMHGHELDPLNRRITPRLGRFLGLSASIVEYTRGYPVFTSEVIGEALLKIEDRFLAAWPYRSKGIAMAGADGCSMFVVERRPPASQRRIEELVARCRNHRKNEDHDVIISAHTHKPFRVQNWYFNSGSWTGNTNNFIRILPDGQVAIYDWEESGPMLNQAMLRPSLSLAASPEIAYESVN